MINTFELEQTLKELKLKKERENHKDFSIEYKDFILYSYWRASCPYRVRLALNLKEIPYTIKPINLLKKEDYSEEYLKINSHGRLPILEFTVVKTCKKVKTTVTSYVERLSESTSILEFLEEAFPDKYPLYPSEKDKIIEKNKIKALAYHLGFNIHPIQNIHVLQKVGELGQDKLEWAKHFIYDGLTSLEVELKLTKGKYCWGDKVTFVDIYLIPQLYFFKRYNISIEEKFPVISEIAKNLSVIPAFIKAEPENQIDAC